MTLATRSKRTDDRIFGRVKEMCVRVCVCMCECKRKDVLTMEGMIEDRQGWVLDGCGV